MSNHNIYILMKSHNKMQQLLNKNIKTYFKIKCIKFYMIIEKFKREYFYFSK